MADRVLLVTWGTTVRGREERALEVFNEAMGILGRMQQDGRIERFNVVLCAPNGHMDGYMALEGSAEQLAAVKEDDEFRRNTADASLIVEKLQHIEGVTNEGIAREVELYQESIQRVPQMS
jgi:hypothetical protein